MTARARAVLDASVLVRAAVRGEGDALPWVRAVAERDLEGFLPDLVFAEAAHALLRYVRAGILTPGRGAEILRELVSLPVRAVPLRELAPAAFSLALARDVSVYDACYLALALSADAVLVTADRRLAEVAERSELLGSE